jgi:uncharacterized membrane protein YjfL (UPF0719 family)
MNEKLILEGIIEIAISLVTGFLVFFASIKMFMLLTRKINENEELKKNNIAVAFVLCAFILALILIVNAAVSPSMDTLRVLFEKEGAVALDIVIALARVVISYIVSGLVGLVILWLCMAIYTGLTTKVDEMAELGKNNLAVGIVFGTFIFSAGLLALEPLSTILRAFVASPEVANTETTAVLVNTPILIQGLIELPIALFGTILVFLLGVFLASLVTRKIDDTAELKRNNVALGIYTASSVFSVMLLIQSSLSPAYRVLGIILDARAPNSTDVILAIVRILAFFLGTAIVAFIFIVLALLAFMRFTKKIDEMEELKKNNVAIALILAVLTISIVILVGHGMRVLLDGFVGSPQTGTGLRLPPIKIR